ncbi:MAG: hypothetical protein MUO88_17155, partial [Desulfobacterales bacterium]|nr:hypothetical protein [Desulfobacterales bacterium]
IIFSMGLWLLFVWKKQRGLYGALSLPAEPTHLNHDRSWRLSLLLVSVIYLVVPFNINQMYAPGYNQWVGEWPLLGENGSILAWVQSIFSGGIYGRDFYCLYGPLMIYPLVWAMKLFGVAVSISRYYTYVLHLLGYVIIISFLYRCLKLKSVFVICALLYLIVFFPTAVLSPNFSNLRVAVGVLSILLCHLYFENEKKHVLPVIGFVLGFSLFFSQEVGVCTLISIGFVFAVKGAVKRNLKQFVSEIGFIFAGLLIPVVPLLLYFYQNGALLNLFDCLYGYPRLVTYGFGAFPFPDFRAFIAAPLKSVAFDNYWIIFVYIPSAFCICRSFFLRFKSPDHLLKLLLLIFGVFLFRAALGRTGLERAQYVSPPAFLLLFIFLDRAVLRALTKGIKIERILSLISATAIAFLFLLLFSYSIILNMNLRDLKNELSNIHRKISISPSGYSIPGLARGNIYFDRNTAAAIFKINEFLDKHTSPGEYVYFFPNEAAYYFLFNRNNPTRFALSYMAITRDHRLELINDLEKKQPRYVVYSRKTWRIDDIPETIQVPEVYGYIMKKYKTVVDFGGVISIMERIE